MIPTLLVVGLILGLGVAARWVVLAVGVGVISLAWGIGIGVTDEATLTSVVGSFLLAAANLAIGARVGVGVRTLAGRRQGSARNIGQDPA